MNSVIGRNSAQKNLPYVERLMPQKGMNGKKRASWYRGGLINYIL